MKKKNSSFGLCVEREREREIFLPLLSTHIHRIIIQAMYALIHLSTAKVDHLNNIALVQMRFSNLWGQYRVSLYGEYVCIYIYVYQGRSFKEKKVNYIDIPIQPPDGASHGWTSCRRPFPCSAQPFRIRRRQILMVKHEPTQFNYQLIIFPL